MGPSRSGKSSILTRITKVLPKIGMTHDAHFIPSSTTVSPVLGHLKFIDNQKLILMDFPGLVIKPKSQSHGSMEFEHQLPGAKLYLFVVDVNHPEVVFQINYFVANKKVFHAERDSVIVLNKVDVASKEHLEFVESYLQKLGLEYQLMSVYKRDYVTNLVKLCRNKILD